MGWNMMMETSVPAVAQRLASVVIGAFLAIWVAACTVVSDGMTPPPPGDGNGGPPGETRNLRLAFDAQGGNFAVGEDEHGNEFSFRARESAGTEVLMEVKLRQADGSVLTVSLDSQGRPVNFRASDNTAADLVYEGDSVRVRLTAPDGTVIDEAEGLDITAARTRVAARRATSHEGNGSAEAETRQVSAEVTITAGLSTYEEVVLSILDEDLNADSPLVGSSFEDAALIIADIPSVVEITEVRRVELGSAVVLDIVPPEIERLAGQTFVLFDAEGFCLESTDVASRLTFDNDGLLQSEFDRSLVLTDFSLGGRDPGVTVNYAAGTPIRLTAEGDSGFEAFVTPIFTATQVDDFRRITIERRFEAEVDFDAAVFGSGIVSLARLFDAALINGRLSDDGDLLEFDLVLVDLELDSPIATTGRLRYHNQNSSQPPRVFACDALVGGRVTSTIICPAEVLQGEVFDVTFIPGREYGNVGLAFDWFVSDGFGLVWGDPLAPQTEVLATAPGFLEVSVVVDAADSLDFEVFGCGVNVARVLEVPPPNLDLTIECPLGLNLGETGLLVVFGRDIVLLDSPEWFVFGTSDVYLSDPFELATEIEIYRSGKFEVALQAFDPTGREVFISCEIVVGGAGFDECEINGWYDDGVCDEFCPEPDPDCDVFFDICEINGWYGDGECDDFCPDVDPDCLDTFIDVCAEEGLYGDGACDLFCPEPDPDCHSFDLCFANGWYNDGVCDDFCPLPDPDCELPTDDFCEEFGYYGDGQCDEDCPQPDPDCEFPIDVCEENDYYNDGICDDFCLLPDPDCG